MGWEITNSTKQKGNSERMSKKKEVLLMWGQKKKKRIHQRTLVSGSTRGGEKKGPIVL